MARGFSGKSHAWGARRDRAIGARGRGDGFEGAKVGTGCCRRPAKERRLVGGKGCMTGPRGRAISAEGRVERFGEARVGTG